MVSREKIVIKYVLYIVRIFLSARTTVVLHVNVLFQLLTRISLRYRGGGMPSSSVGKVLGHQWLSRWLMVRRSAVQFQVGTRISGKFLEIPEMRQL